MSRTEPSHAPGAESGSLSGLFGSVAAASALVRAKVGAVTMYRLVLGSLIGLSVVALIESFLGFGSYPPLALLATLSASLVACYLSNRALAAMFRVVPHSESSLITAFLIFFIFPPSLHVLPILGVALAAVLASGSKYILAFRGRHLFNPAAAGAFLLTLTGFYYSGWWIGTPGMLPFTLIVAFVICYRLRRLSMALVFLAVAGSIMAVRSLVAGIPLGLALEWPFTSSPMIFFAGLMLTEPLTQPPLRWQRLGFAGIIGVFFSVPMHVGSIYIAPESALLIGNALAFLAGQRKAIELTMQQRTQLTPSTTEFAFRPSGRLSFRAGQYLELTIPHRHADSRGLRRVFSIASAPGSDLLRIGTRMPEHSSSFKQVLGDLPEGSVITATSIAGDFLLPRNPRIPLLLVAGGIGITPFASQIQDLGPDHGRDIVVIYAVQDAADVSYRAVLEAAGVPVVLVSRNAIGDLPDRWRSVPTGHVDTDLLAGYVPDIAGREVHVSGPPAMVEAVAAAARGLGARAVRTDFFSGY